MKLRNQLAVFGAGLTTLAINAQAAVPAGITDKVDGLVDDVSVIGASIIGVAVAVLAIILIKGLLKRGS